jgi:hypothetical protein
MNTTRLPPWRTACNGGGKRIWFLIRGSGLESDRIPVRDRYRYNSRGDLIRYASRETALRAATRLNNAEASEHAETNCAHVRARLAYREPGYAAALEDAAAGIVL